MTIGGGVDREIFYQGGHDDDLATNTVELLDLGVPNPQWKFVAAMHNPRVLCDSVVLPTGKILVVGGSSTGKSDVAVDPVLPTELFDPASDTWTELAPINCPHMYRSTALLLHDGRVMRGGKDGQFQRDPYKYFEHRLELFSPPYLFNGPRPEISSAPAAGHYGQDMTIGCPAPGDIAPAALIRCGAVTHSFHMDQRYVGVEIEIRATSELTVKLPPNGNVSSRHACRTSTPRSIGNLGPPAYTSVIGNSRSSIAVTTPKLLPPPRSAQNRSGSLSRSARTIRPSAVTTSIASTLLAARPYLRPSQRTGGCACKERACGVS